MAAWILMALIALCLVSCVHEGAGPKTQEGFTERIALTQLEPGKTVVVVPRKPASRTQYAGAVLREWLLKATGATEGFELVEEGSARVSEEGVFILAVGATEYADAKRTAGMRADAFSMVRKGNVVAMSGEGEFGPLYGVVAFLDRVAGVRFYLPGEKFTRLPEDQKVRVGALDVVSEPYVASCFMSGIELGDPVMRSWLVLNGGLRRKGGTHQHNMYAMFPPERYGKSDPEIYPIIAGKRHIPASAKDQGWQINFLEPKTLEIAERSVLEFLKNNPNDAYATMSVNDGYAMSQDESTTAWLKAWTEKHPGKDARDRATSALYWEFIDKLGGRLMLSAPGKRLVCLAYGPTRFAPEKKLPGNVVVFTNYHVSELPTEGTAQAGKTPLEGWLDDWMRVTENFGNHDWYQGSGYLMPRVYSGYWATFLRTLKTRMDGPYMHAECYPNWGLDGPKLWVLTRLWWDPSQDPAKLTRQFCDDMFGAGADGMAAYFQAMEEMWDRINVVEGPERKLNRWESQFRSTAESRKLLARGRAGLTMALSAQMSAAERERVVFFSDCFGMTERFFALSGRETVSEADLKEGEAYIEKKVLSYPMSLHHKHLALPAWREVYWAKRKAIDRKLTVPFGKPTADSGAGGGRRGGAQAVDWTVKGAANDPQNTSAEILHDGAMLYLRVMCPRMDMQNMVEVDDDGWRSDNVEVFFDLDGDKRVFERQMWVKTNGRVVDHSGREKPNGDIKGKVTKEAAGYAVEIAVPLAYARQDALSRVVGIRMVRNEFERVNGAYEQKYAASWTGTLTLAGND